MQIRQILTLRGPNLWSRAPALEVKLEPCDRGRADLNQVAGQVKNWLTGVKPDAGRWSNPATWAELLRNVAIDLQYLAGAKLPEPINDKSPTVHGERIAVPFDEELVGREAVLTAQRIITAATDQQPIDISAQLQRLTDLADQRCLGPSTRAIVEAAHKRGIPTVRLNRGSFVQLGYGAKQRRIRTAETDQTSAVAESICADKDLTKRLLAAVGVPVPEGRPVSDREDAWAAAEEIEQPVVVKPIDGNHGRGVFTGLTTKQQIQSAYDIAVEEGSGVLVEQFAPGREHRLLVVGGKLVAATGGEPAYVTGDGASSIEQLVESQLNSDPRRGEGYDTPLSKVELIDPVTLMVLDQQGYNTTSVPPAGQSVLLQRNGNLAIDVTDRVHPDVAARAVDAARVIGLDIAGIDLVVEDIGKPLESQRGMIVEVNAGPGLQMHLSPMVGQPRPVGQAIVDSLFPSGEQGRIPIAAIVGSGDTVAGVASLLGYLLRFAFGTTGVVSGGQARIDGRQISMETPAALLISPMIEAAVYCLTLEEIRKGGLPFDRCQLAVFISESSSSDLRDAEIRGLLVDSLIDGGCVVAHAKLLNEIAADPSLRSVVVSEQLGEIVDQHIRQGGASCAIIEEMICIIALGQRHPIAPAASRLPFQLDLQERLFAIAAAWASGVPIDRLQQALAAAGS